MEEEVVQVEELVKVEYPKVTAKIVDVSTFGVINITFSENMFVNSTDFSWIDDTVLDLELVPYFIPEDMDPAQLGFTW